jgi:hypothetical protein
LKSLEITEEIVSLLEPEDIEIKDLTVEEQQAIALISFSTYCAALDSVIYESYTLEESFMSDFKDAAAHVAHQASQLVSRIVSDAKDAFPKIMKATGIALSDLITAFKDPSIFKLLKAFGFSIGKILKVLLSFSGAIRDGLLKIFAEIEKTGAIQKIKSRLKTVDELLKEHPHWKAIGGVVVAGALVYIWLNMTFIGDLHFDFDWSNIVGALHGDYSLADLFASSSGLMMLTLLVTNLTLGLSVPWLCRDAYNITLALVYTGFLKAKENDLAGKVKKLIPG